MYWTTGEGKIQRANLKDGSGVEDLVTGLGYPHSIALDVAASKMYWTHSNWQDLWAGKKTSKIQRANLDGSSVEDLVTELVNPYGIALDVAAGKMYWAHNDTSPADIFAGKEYDKTGKIQRANLDGSGIEDLVTELDWPADIALDLAVGPTGN